MPQEEEKKQALSFKFTKKTERRELKDSHYRDVSTKTIVEETDFVKSVDENKIEGTKKAEEKKQELVIPLIKTNQWRVAKKDKDEGGVSVVSDADDDVTVIRDADDDVTVIRDDVSAARDADADAASSDNLESCAARELLAESRRQLEDWENRGEDGERKVESVPLLVANAAPAGFETDEHLDVDLRAEASTMDDYENVPIEDYGLAMLRGMGWKEGEGIGGFRKELVSSIDPVVRPKGLGLGASKAKKAAAAGAAAAAGGDAEELALAAGAYVVVESGAHKDMYGQVEGMDQDSARVFVRLALGGSAPVSISENAVRAVPKKEYKERAKVINQGMYEEYREKQKERERLEWGRGGDEAQSKNQQAGSPSAKRSRGRSASPSSGGNGCGPSSSARDRYGDASANSREANGADARPQQRPRLWVRPNLRVRYIDKEFKSGSYFNKKMVVFDVSTPESCTLRCDDGRVIDDVHPKHIETLVPKSDRALVMVVRGALTGRVGEVLRRDKRQCVAAVQIDEDVHKFDFDDICEFVGDHAFARDKDNDWDRSRKAKYESNFCPTAEWSKNPNVYNDKNVYHD